MTAEDRFKVFVGIDCGTTYSGFCFAVGRESKDYHVQPQAGADGQKIPTALLLEKDGSLCAFGQHAIDEYSTLDEEERAELLFYDRFKTDLFYINVSALRAHLEVLAVFRIRFRILSNRKLSCVGLDNHAGIATMLTHARPCFFFSIHIREKVVLACVVFRSLVGRRSTGPV